MLVTLAGAMSTAELGLSLAEMIRQDKVHAICCTGANLEEDIFNLVAHDHYVRIPHYRALTAGRGRSCWRGTSTASPTPASRGRGDPAHRARVLEEWQGPTGAASAGFRTSSATACCVPGAAEHYQIDPATAGWWRPARRTCPSSCPGWEDSTLGNIFASHVITAR
jgi:deoxyhypusine synthase